MTVVASVRRTVTWCTALLDTIIFYGGMPAFLFACVAWADWKYKLQTLRSLDFVPFRFRVLLLELLLLLLWLAVIRISRYIGMLIVSLQYRKKAAR